MNAATLRFNGIGKEIRRFARGETPDRTLLQQVLPARPIMAIGIDNGVAVWRQTGEDFALGLRHALQ